MHAVSIAMYGIISDLDIISFKDYNYYLSTP